MEILISRFSFSFYCLSQSRAAGEEEDRSRRRPKYIYKSWWQKRAESLNVCEETVASLLLLSGWILDTCAETTPLCTRWTKQRTSCCTNGQSPGLPSLSGTLTVWRYTWSRSGFTLSKDWNLFPIKVTSQRWIQKWGCSFSSCVWLVSVCSGGNTCHRTPCLNKNPALVTNAYLRRTRGSHSVSTNLLNHFCQRTTASQRRLSTGGSFYRLKGATSVPTEKQSMGCFRSSHLLQML